MSKKLPTIVPTRISKRKTKGFHSLYSPKLRQQQEITLKQIVAHRTNVMVHQMAQDINSKTGASLEYRHLVKSAEKEVWQTTLANEFDRLVNGVGKRMHTGTNTMIFRPKSAVPTTAKVTYARLVSKIRPQKSETHPVRMTVGDNLLDYADDTRSPTVALITSKILFNSIVSTQNAKFLGLDIKNFYLQTTLPNSQLMKFPINLIPTEIIKQYNLQDIQHNNWVYLEIVKGMYGLKKSRKLASNQLVEHLAPYGYVPCKCTTGL